MVFVSLRGTQLDSSHLESHVVLVLYPLGMQSPGWLEHGPLKWLTHLAGKLLLPSRLQVSVPLSPQVCLSDPR